MIASRFRLPSVCCAATLSLACGGPAAHPGDATGAQIDPATGLPICPTDPAKQTSDACVDGSGGVRCKASSGFAGDELALCQPSADEGMLFHYGPKDYSDPAQVALFTLDAGGEDETCTFVHSPNTAERFVKSYHGRLRPHSHHLIVTTIDHEVADDDSPVKCTPTDVVGARWLVGAQSPIMDVTMGGAATGNAKPIPTDPDYQLAQKIPAQVPMRLDLHYVNVTDQPILKEAWVSFDYAKSYEVKNLVDMITFFQGSINVPPHGSQTTAMAQCTAPTDRYVALLTGHFHKTGTRFTVDYTHADGTVEKVYETFSWSEPGNLYYRNGVAIEPSDATTKRMGGDHPGYLHLKAGESLSFQCEFDNQTDKAVRLGETSGDEMCNTFGMFYPTAGNVWSCTCLAEKCF